MGLSQDCAFDRRLVQTSETDHDDLAFPGFILTPVAIEIAL